MWIPRATPESSFQCVALYTRSGVSLETVDDTYETFAGQETVHPNKAADSAVIIVESPACFCDTAIRKHLDYSPVATGQDGGHFHFFGLLEACS